MAKQKKQQRGPAGQTSGRAAVSSSPAEQAPAEKAPVTPDAVPDSTPGDAETVAFDPPLAPPAPRFGLGSYVLFNVIFDAFCLLQLLLVRVVLGEQRGLYFFFALLMVAFLIVSIYDYLYDRYVDPVPDAAE